MTAYVKKYRPKNLNEVVGQPVAVNQIKGMLKDKGEFNQVIAIFGPSGYGKTTIARIIGCAINDIPYTEKYSDLHEANVGSNRGIDDIREISAMAQYRPKHKYRVIIMDEIQAATGVALSAALKLLEDAPKQTVFILCSDQPQRLPATVLRRAKKIYLQRSEPKDIIPLLERVEKAEKLKLPNSKKLLLKIAEYTQGQPCEALQALESVSDCLRGNPKADLAECFKVVTHAGKPMEVEDVAIKVLAACYLGRVEAVAKGAQILGSDAMSSIFLLLNFNSYIINSHTGARGYYSPAVKKLEEILDKLPSLNRAIQIHNSLVNIRETALIAGNITDNHTLVAKLTALANHK